MRDYDTQRKLFASKNVKHADLTKIKPIDVTSVDERTKHVVEVALNALPAYASDAVLVLGYTAEDAFWEVVLEACAFGATLAKIEASIDCESIEASKPLLTRL